MEDKRREESQGAGQRLSQSQASHSNGAGMGPRCAVKHSYERRANWNDYRARRIYMVTLKLIPKFPPLSRISGNIRAHAGAVDAPFAALSDCGRVVKSTIEEVCDSYPHIGIVSKVIMPDHIHLIIFVKEQSNTHLGRVIGHIKSLCSSRLSHLKSEDSFRPNGNRASKTIFQPNYHDRILTNPGQLETMVRYVEDNPRRLALKRSLPDLFQRCNKIRIGDETLDAFGNPFLLRRDLIKDVHVRRIWTEEERLHYKETRLNDVKQGAVLVSPFISPAEKEILREAIERGASIIRLVREGMPPRFKPSGKEFELCCAGRLLILTPWEYQTEKSSLSRQDAVRLNNLAELIANGVKDVGLVQ